MSSIGSTLNSINQSLLSEISAYQAATQTAGPSTTQTSSSTSSTSDRVDLSQVGKLFQELKDLQSSDPAEFKKVLTDAATQLKNAAQQQTDPKQASFLSNLADKFQKAADSGDLSALRPDSSSTGAAYGPHGHHRHHHGQAADSTNTSTDSQSTPTQDSSTSPNLLTTLLGNSQSTETGSLTSNLLSLFGVSL